MPTITTEAEILVRAMDVTTPSLSQEAVQSLGSFDFAPEDHLAMSELVAKAQAGKLTSSERASLDKYELVNDLLGILRSRSQRGQ